MTENAFQAEISGEEVQQDDVNQLGATGGLADDHVFAEILRLRPYNSGSSIADKAIAPFGRRLSQSPATVQPTGSANGSVQINPFRAFVGSRNAVSSAPAGLSTDSASLATWRDIRSGVFTGTATTLAATLAIAPNSTGTPRWDLVYATISVDADGPSVDRRVKDPTTGVASVESVPEYICSPVTVSVLTGTAGGSPALPALPVDGGGAYNIPLAFVRVPNGFSSTTTVVAQDIRATTFGTASDFVKVGGGLNVKAANCNNDENGAFNAGGSFAWDPTTAGSRPAPWMSPDLVGGTTIVAQIDNSSATSSQWSHQSLGAVDSSIDWRKRVIRVTASFPESGMKFATDPTATANSETMPFGGDSDRPTLSIGSSVIADSAVVSAYSTIWTANVDGSVVALLVSQSTGILTWYNSYAGGTGPEVRFFFWIEASGQIPNV